MKDEISMRAVTYKQAGDTEVLELTDEPIPTPKPQDLLIKVHATALNRADISQRRGTYPPPPGHSPILGLEIAGEVVDWGSDVNSTKFPKGMRVFGLVDGGGYAEYCLLDQAMAIPIPDDWDYVYAAAIPEAFLTSQVCLFQLGELTADESILIHAGGSGIGTAAIQMAKARDAKVFFTAGTDEKIQRCLELGADHGINYKIQDFFEAIKELTQQQGVNVILDPVGENYFARNINLLQTEGRLILIAKMSGDKAEFSIGRLIMKRLQIKGNSMRSRPLSEKRLITAKFCQDWLPLLLNKKIRPIIDSVFNFDDVVQAHRYMESNQNFGKIILKII